MYLSKLQCNGDNKFKRKEISKEIPLEEILCYSITDFQLR